MMWRLLLFVFFMFFLWWLWLVTMENLSCDGALHVTRRTCGNAWRYFNEFYRIYQLRQTVYPIYQTIEPFEHEVASRGVCKYFRFYRVESCDRDFSQLTFGVRGITAEYKDHPAELKPLLEALLQDFYIERLGNLSFPAVYAKNIQEGEATFLVANNAYGNERIGQIREADRLKGAPNMDALEDE